MSVAKLSVTLLLCALAACGKSDRATSDTTSAMGPGTMTPPAASSGAAMAGNGMTMGNAHSDSIASHAQVHLDSLKAATPDAAVKRVPEYKQAITALLADCERMMADMKMTPPAKWNTAAGAVRADLAKMASANAGALHAMLPEHAERVKGILDMRQDMMKK